MKFIPTTFCGEAGSRLWAVSRELPPKPFIRLADGQSLLQKTRLRGVAQPDVVDLAMIEVQSGEYLGEDDIVRFENIYGRRQ